MREHHTVAGAPASAGVVRITCSALLHPAAHKCSKHGSVTTFSGLRQLDQHLTRFATRGFRSRWEAPEGSSLARTADIRASVCYLLGNCSTVEQMSRGSDTRGIYGG